MLRVKAFVNGKASPSEITTNNGGLQTDRCPHVETGGIAMNNV